MYGERLFGKQNETILERAYRFFAALLSQMDLSNVDTWEA